jgi:hypothetical protein
MKRFLFAFALMLTSHTAAYAWGDLGHKIVCEVAFRVAAPDTRSEIRKLIQHDAQFDFFRDACTFPDHPRKRANEHFIYSALL